MMIPLLVCFLFSLMASHGFETKNLRHYREPKVSVDTHNYDPMFQLSDNPLSKNLDMKGLIIDDEMTGEDSRKESTTKTVNGVLLLASHEKNDAQVLNVTQRVLGFPWREGGGVVDKGADFAPENIAMIIVFSFLGVMVIGLLCQYRNKIRNACCN